MNSGNNVPSFPEPLWRDNIEKSFFPKLEEDLSVDVAVVGAGITGITTAYLLVKEGLKVALIDSGSMLNGTTGHSTAKVTAQHDIIYDEFIQHFGTEQAKLYYQANMDALQFVEQTIAEQQIDCDFSKEDAYIFTNSEQKLSKLNKEYKAYERLGIEGELVDKLPIDLQVKSALVMKNQGQFHPVKYLLSLVDTIKSKGAQIFENTTAVDVEEGENPKVVTRDGHKITCKHVVAASHFPFIDGGGAYFTRMYAERSYILAVKAEKDFPKGMYISAETPKRSLRYTTLNGEKVLLIAGEKHKTGQGISTSAHYDALHQFAKEHFGIKDYLYRWSAQDLTTLDKKPYIGRITTGKKNIYIATGFRKWGMSNGTASAMLISNMILDKETPYKELFKPSRFTADPSIRTFITQNIDVAGHLIEGKLDRPDREVGDLQRDEGAVVNEKGKRAGAYRDKDGQLHLVDTTCTHLGCEVEWNDGDRTWDCPCHGSRFSYTGEVVEGPAEKPLKRID